MVLNKLKLQSGVFSISKQVKITKGVNWNYQNNTQMNQIFTIKKKDIKILREIPAAKYQRCGSKVKILLFNYAYLKGFRWMQQLLDLKKRQSNIRIATMIDRNL